LLRFAKHKKTSAAEISAADVNFKLVDADYFAAGPHQERHC
jgi:hypothetical protein